MGLETMQVLVLMYEDESYADLDQASGGYPYKVPNILRARIWPSEEKMLKYNEMFPKLRPYKVTIMMERELII